MPEVANHVPHVRVTWDAAAKALTPAAVVKALRDGEPSIAIRSEGPALVIGVWMMQPGEEKIVARRLRQVLEQPGTRHAIRSWPTCCGAPRLPLLAAARRLRSWARSIRPLPPRTPRRCASRPTSPPRNDILIENRVPDPHARRRDALRRRLSAGRRRALSGPRLENAVQHRALPHRLRRGRLLRAARLRLRLPGRARTPRIGRRLGAVLRRREGRLRHDRVGREAALVERQGRHAGRLLSRTEPVAGRAGRAAQPRHHLSDGGLHEHLPRLDHAQRRLAAVVQLRLGAGPAGIADHAEPRAPHARRACARSTTTRSSGTCR